MPYERPPVDSSEDPSMWSKTKLIQELKGMDIEVPPILEATVIENEAEVIPDIGTQLSPPPTQTGATSNHQPKTGGYSDEQHVKCVRLYVPMCYGLTKYHYPTSFEESRRKAAKHNQDEFIHTRSGRDSNQRLYIMSHVRSHYIILSTSAEKHSKSTRDYCLRNDDRGYKYGRPKYFQDDKDIYNNLNSI
ncbi:unnamed protein product [Mytilus edulis]|uniref:Uncharacterized protein n=1 Tax=Mytilus edulis TaxID=6550 RepID=A0A8S3TME3_MYTED|nr:unnamed protein product [Mytilus edulis]